MTGTRDRSALWWLRGVMPLCAAALVATGCAGHKSHPHTLVFDVTGSGTLSSVTYAVNGKKTTEQSVGLPWRKTIHLPAKDGGHTWSLETRGSSDDVVSVDGHVVSEGACQGDGCSGGGSGSIRD